MEPRGIFVIKGKENVVAQDIASVKTVIGAAKKVVGLLDIAHKNIKKFEQQLDNMTLQISTPY